MCQNVFFPGLQDTRMRRSKIERRQKDKKFTALFKFCFRNKLKFFNKKSILLNKQFY